MKICQPKVSQHFDFDFCTWEWLHITMNFMFCLSQPLHGVSGARLHGGRGPPLVPPAPPPEQPPAPVFRQERQWSWLYPDRERQINAGMRHTLEATCLELTGLEWCGSGLTFSLMLPKYWGQLRWTNRPTLAATTRKPNTFSNMETLALD